MPNPSARVRVLLNWAAAGHRPGFLGARTAAYQTADLGAHVLSLPAGTGTFGLAIPVSPAYVGTYLAAQSVAFSLLNPLNLIFSNGTQITIGN